MRHIAFVAVVALAIGASAFAQDAPQNLPVADQPALDEPADSAQPESTPPGNALSTTGHSTTVYHGPHRYPLHSRGRAGDPPFVDHSHDTLQVEPTHSTITIMVPIVSAQQ